MGALYGLSEFTDNDCWKIFQHPQIFDNIIASISKISGSFNTGHPTNSARPHVEQGMNQTYEEYKNKAKELIFYMEWLIREKYENIPNEHIRTVYEPFFEILIKKIIDAGEGYSPIVPFFTTNYDMSIDWFFNPEDDNDISINENWQRNFTNQIVFIDGFDTRGWTRNEYKKIDEKITGSIFVPYFKLHGSLLWEERKGRIRKATSIVNDPHNPGKQMIVYPSNKKTLNEDPYYFNHRSMEVYLKRTDILLVIGFSFRDPAIVSMIETALLDNESLNVIVVSPQFDPKYFLEMINFLKRERVIRIDDYFGETTVIGALEKIL